ncbi:MAG: glycosyltransferase family 39 protein, partial [Chloroflexi bacterium]|nr:glycosyltransferase family 39 protein [Chloroflexota bacterium]
MKLTKHLEQRTIWMTLLFVLGLAGFALVWVGTPQGVGTSPDAVSYISASRSLLAGDGWRQWDGDLMAHWAPLYPTMLAVLNVISDAFNVPLLHILRVVNGLTLMAIIIGSGLWFDHFLTSRWLALLGTLSILFSYPFVLITFFAYSEPLFVLFTLLALHFLLRFISERHWSLLVAAGAVVAVACLQRYLGIALTLTGGLSILLLMRGTPWIKRFVYGFVFGVIASVPLAAWMLRNYLETNTLTGERNEPVAALRDNFSDSYFTLFRWFFPEGVSFGYFRASAVLLVLLILWLLLVYRREHHLTLQIMIRALPFPAEILPLVIFLMSYPMFFIVGSSGLMNLTVIDDRYLCPIYMPAMLVVFIMADRLAGWLNQRASFNKIPAAGTLLVAVVITLWLIYPADRVISQVRASSKTDYHPEHDSPIIRALQDSRPDGIVYSNYPLWPLIYAGLRSDAVPSDQDAWAELDPKADVVVWFNDLSLCTAPAERKRYCIPTAYGLPELIT